MRSGKPAGLFALPGQSTTWATAAVALYQSQTVETRSSLVAERKQIEEPRVSYSGLFTDPAAGLWDGRF